MLAGSTADFPLTLNQEVVTELLAAAVLRVCSALGTAVCGGLVASVPAAALLQAECSTFCFTSDELFTSESLQLLYSPPTVCMHASVCVLVGKLNIVPDDRMLPAPPLPTTSTSVAHKHGRCVSEFAFDLLSCFSLSGVTVCIITCGCFRLPFFFFFLVTSNTFSNPRCWGYNCAL